MKKSFEDWYEELKKNLKETKEELIENYAQEKKEKLEKTKKRYKYANITVVIITFIVDVTLLILLAKGIYKNEGLIIIIALILFLMLFLSLIINGIVKSKLFSRTVQQKEQSRDLYKKIVITNLINNFFDNVIYKLGERMPYDIYDEAKWNMDFSEYYSEDYFEGLIDKKYQLKMAEIKTSKTRSYVRGGMITETQFHGVFARIEMNKSIGMRFTIRPKKILNLNKKNEMDIQELKKHFDVTFDNEIILMKVMTPEIIKGLISLQKITNNGSWISIKDDKIYLRIPTGPIFKSGKLENGKIIVDKEELNRDYRILEKVYSFSKTIIDSIENAEI